MTTFVRIADTGNISRAARSLGLSVAMASRHLRWLEDDVGVPLMRRTTRRLDLTDAGLEFVTRARAILAGLEEAKIAVRPGHGVAGRVVLSVAPSLGLGQVGPLVRGLLDDNPRLRIEIRFEDRVVDLLEDGVDVAVRAGCAPPDSGFVVARHLATFERVLCASPRLLAKMERIDDVAKLAELPCVLHGAAPTEWVFQTAGGRESVTVNGRLRTNNLLAVRDAIVAGMGIGWLPSWLAEDDFQTRRLKRVLEGMTMPGIDVYGLFHAQGRANGAVRAVLECLASELPRSLSRGEGAAPRGRRKGRRGE